MDVHICIICINTCKQLHTGCGWEHCLSSWYPPIYILHDIGPCIPMHTDTYIPDILTIYTRTHTTLRATPTPPITGPLGYPNGTYSAIFAHIPRVCTLYGPYTYISRMYRREEHPESAVSGWFRRSKMAVLTPPNCTRTHIPRHHG